ncbi:MAG: 30S ribosomal protein S13, partial [Patescibacteria group bacterium]
MARISGVDLPDSARIDYALTRIKGIGWALSKKLLEDLKMDSAKRMSTLTPDELATVSTKVDELGVEGDLVRRTRGDIQRLQVIGSFRGSRHSKGLPARGQRTRTNARTKRGKRKTIGAFKKEVLAKT